MLLIYKKAATANPMKLSMAFTESTLMFEAALGCVVGAELVVEVAAVWANVDQIMRV